MTEKQTKILNIVLNSYEHLSAEQIFLLVKTIIPGVALGTIYRNLNQFADKKLIRRVSRTNGPDYFEKNLTPHDHMTCVRCGQISDISIKTLKDFIEEKLGCEIVSFDLMIDYVCQQCKEKYNQNERNGR